MSAKDVTGEALAQECPETVENSEKEASNLDNLSGNDFNNALDKMSRTANETLQKRKFLS